MNFQTSLSLTALIILLSGCSLIPKPVEFGQSKVKAVPAKSETYLEDEKRAAQFVAKKVDEAHIEAVRADSPAAVITPLVESKPVAYAVSASLGFPETPWATNKTGTELAARLNKDSAKLDTKLQDYKEDVAPLVGKKIEGTGIFQMSYFTYIIILFCLYLAIKFGLSVWSVFNPAVGVGMNIAKIPAGILKRGFSEVVAGGEAFKENLEKTVEDPATVEKVLQLFRVSQERKQSQEVQELIKTLTK